MKRILLLLVLVGLLVAFIWLPLSIPADSDFQFLYNAGLGLGHGISPYDFAGLTGLIASEEGPAAAKVNVPYAYPPWYALVAVPLALFAPPQAARLWFLFNLVMLMGAVWFLTDGWLPRRRLTAFLAASLFLPVAGGIYVGQYDFPILLGTAMLGYALTHQKVGLTAVGLALLTFKPHVGTLILLAGLIYLFSRRDEFSRRALRFTLLAGLFLFAIGFAASRIWPLDYVRSLLAFKEIRQCTQCNSLAMVIPNLARGDFNWGIATGIILLALAVAALVWQRRALTERPVLLVSAATLTTLLVSPFLHNYDYMLLLVPLFVIAGQAHGLDWIWLAIAFLIPLPGFLIPGFEGAFSLILSTLMVTALFARMLRQPALVPAPA